MYLCLYVHALGAYHDRTYGGGERGAGGDITSVVVSTYEKSPPFRRAVYNIVTLNIFTFYGVCQ